MCEGTGNCPECDGDGICIECDGEGKIITELLNLFDIREYISPLQLKEDALGNNNIALSLGYFEAYLTAFEDFLSKESKSVRDYIADLDGNLYPVDDLEKYLKSLDSTFPDLFRRSFFVITFSLIETGLQEICESVHSQHGLLSPDLFFAKHKVYGSEIDRAREYLIKEAKLSFPISREWRALCDCNKLRNCIIHQGGRLGFGKRDNYLKSYIRKHPFLSIDNDFIVIHNQFCGTVIKDVRAFFKQLKIASEGLQSN